MHELGFWQESGLVILLAIDKNSKIYFYYNILVFNYFVNEKIKNIKKTLFNF